jgi:hypothetical protein
MIVGITGASAGWVPRSTRDADEYLRERDEARELHRACQEEYRSLDAARQEALRELANATQAATLNRDAAAREATAHRCTKEARDARDVALAERDNARADHLDQFNRCGVLRAFLRAEASTQDARGRPRLANRLREAASASWTSPETETTAWRQIMYEWPEDEVAEDEVAAPELPEEGTAVRIGANPNGPGSIAEVEWTHASGTRLLSFLGCPPGEWQNALNELRTVIPPPAKTGPELITAAVRELREARSYRLRQQGRSQGFTIVRDVNQQTEREMERVRRDYCEQRDQRRAAQCLVGHWQSIALWIAEQLNIDPPLGGTVDLEERYDAAMEADSR